MIVMGKILHNHLSHYDKNMPKIINKEACPHCGANISPRWEPLNAALVGILIKAIQYVHERNENRFNANRDLGLTHNQAANFQKLRFHGLVAHADQDKRSGYWLITARGGQFLRSEMNVPKQVKVFRNKVMDHSPELVWIWQMKGIPEFNKEFAYETPQLKIIKSSEQTLFA